MPRIRIIDTRRRATGLAIALAACTAAGASAPPAMAAAGNPAGYRAIMNLYRTVGRVKSATVVNDVRGAEPGVTRCLGSFLTGLEAKQSAGTLPSGSSAQTIAQQAGKYTAAVLLLSGLRPVLRPEVTMLQALSRSRVSARARALLKTEIETVRPLASINYCAQMNAWSASNYARSPYPAMANRLITIGKINRSGNIARGNGLSATQASSVVVALRGFERKYVVLYTADVNEVTRWANSLK